MFTAAQIKAFQRALAACDKWEPAINRLKQMAQYAPHFAERIQEIATRCENLRLLASMALSSEQ